MIRPFVEADLEQVIKIWLDASIISHSFVEQDFWISKINDMKEKYIPASETYVYEKNNIIYGFVSLCEDRLAAIFVAPEFQGNGIGKLLISKAMSLRKRLLLTVYKENTKSVRFYETHGFNKINERIDKETGQPEIIMEWLKVNEK